jgi:phytoene dehydrogenase-like protein
LRRLISDAELKATLLELVGPEHRARKAAALDRLIERAEHVIPALRNHIVFREDATPATFSFPGGRVNQRRS